MANQLPKEFGKDDIISLHLEKASELPVAWAYPEKENLEVKMNAPEGTWVVKRVSRSSNGAKTDTIGTLSVKKDGTRYTPN